MRLSSFGNTIGREQGDFLQASCVRYAGRARQVDRVFWARRNASTDDRPFFFFMDRFRTRSIPT